MSDKMHAKPQTADKRSQRGQKAIISCIAVVISYLSLIASAIAQSGQLVVVFVGSGSMWGRIPGARASKLVLIRRELSKLLRSRLPNTAIGLSSFGARANGSCSAARALLPPEVGQLERFDELLERFNPQGRGPVTLGLRTAVESLAPGIGADLLLVHDSPDNCRQDVCAFANELGRTRGNVRVHVLSLGLKPGQRGAMTCVTKATGGTLVEADTADAATAGLGRIFASLQSARPRRQRQKERQLTAPKPLPARPPPASRRTTAIHLSASLTGSRTPIESGLTWKIEQLGNSAMRSLARTFATSTVDVDLPANKYRVSMITSTVTLKKDINVVKDEHNLVQFTFDGGLLDVVLEAGASGVAPAAETLVSVSTASNDEQPATPVWIGPSGQAKALLLAPGTYHVTAGNGLTRQAKTISIAAGATERAVFGARLAKLIVTATGLRPEQEAAAQIIITTDEPTASNGRRSVTRSSTTNAAFVLPSGPYQITLKAFDTTTRRVVVLAPGQTLTQSLEVNQMALKVSSHIGAKSGPAKASVRYRLWRVGAPDRPIATSRAVQPIFHLSPGKYRIESRIGLQNSVMKREFDVGTAKQGKLELRHRAGQVRFSLPADQHALGQNTYWEVHDLYGRQIWREFTSSLSLTLVEGDYTVSVEAKKKRFKAKFAVVAGHHQTVALIRD